MAQISETVHRRGEHWLQGAYGNMRYWFSPPRNAPPLLFLHGYGAMIEHWNQVLPVFAQTHSCYALDLYGFGYSAALRALPHKHTWAEQVTHFARSVLPEPAILVGNSLGGMVATQVAADHPELVRGLVLVDPTGLPGMAAHTGMAERLVQRAARVPLLGEAIASALNGPQGVRQFLLALYHRKERITPELLSALSGPFRRPHTATFCLNILRHFDHLALDVPLNAVNVPTLIVWGEHDPALPATLAEPFRQRFVPHAEIQIIPDSGHCAFDETPEAFCAIVIPWLTKQQRMYSLT